MFFKDIVGQEELKAQLIASAQSGQISHALLFSGKEGVGKFQLALAFARYIQCTNRQPHDSCGTCPSCRKYNILQHPDLHFVFPITKSDSVCDDYLPQWRDFLHQSNYFTIEGWMQALNAENAQAIIYSKESQQILRKLGYKSYESPYKIMLIWYPERMHPTCANKLLKILEEPWDNTFFFLISNEPELMLPTILSRTQRINVRPIPEETMSAALQQQFNISPQQAATLSHCAQGSVSKAYKLLQVEDERERNFTYFVELMRLAYQRNLSNLKIWSEAIAKIGREKQISFLENAQELLRENFIFNMGIPKINYLSNEEMQFSKNFSRFINTRNVESIMNCFADAQNEIARNANPRILFFDLSIKIIVELKK